MEVAEQPKLSFGGVDVLSVNFNAIAHPNDNDRLEMDYTCSPAVFYPNDDKTLFKILMDIKVSDERFFTLSLRSIGNFKLDRDLTEELKKKFVNNNAPAIMFPYIRSFIATFTANLGEVIGTTITIPTHFFKGELKEIKND